MRITRKQLEAVVERINRITKSPLKPYERNAKGKLVGQIGNYHLQGAYGGYNLARMVNEAGGISDVFHCGYRPKSELYDLLHAYIQGLENK